MEVFEKITDTSLPEKIALSGDVLLGLTSLIFLIDGVVRGEREDIIFGVGGIGLAVLGAAFILK